MIRRERRVSRRGAETQRGRRKRFEQEAATGAKRGLSRNSRPDPGGLRVGARAGGRLICRSVVGYSRVWWVGLGEWWRGCGLAVRAVWRSDSSDSKYKGLPRLVEQE